MTTASDRGGVRIVWTATGHGAHVHGGAHVIVFHAGLTAPQVETLRGAVMAQAERWGDRVDSIEFRYDEKRA